MVTKINHILLRGFAIEYIATTTSMIFPLLAQSNTFSQTKPSSKSCPRPGSGGLQGTLNQAGCLQLLERNRNARRQEGALLTALSSHKHDCCCISICKTILTLTTPLQAEADDTLCHIALVAIGPKQVRVCCLGFLSSHLLSMGELNGCGEQVHEGSR